MKKEELVKLKILLEEELIRRQRINEILEDNLILEYMKEKNMDITKLEVNDLWVLLKEILKNFKISESNGILAYTGSYFVCDATYYQEPGYYPVLIKKDDKKNAEYKEFKDIETNKVYRGYNDELIKQECDIPSLEEFCHKKYRSYLLSELEKQYTLIYPHHDFEDVQKDFFLTSVEKGQAKARKLVINKNKKRGK